jgi:hypothetical protein
MNDQDRSLLRWGGVAGVLGSLMMPAIFAFLAVVGGLETLGPAGEIERFPEMRGARIIENAGYLLTLALWAVNAMALGTVLRTQAPGPALTGAVFLVLGLAVLATGAVPHVVTTPMSDLYHAADTTADLRAALVVHWQAIQGWVDAMVVTGLVLTPFGIAALSLAMLAHPDLRGWPAWAGFALAAAGLVSGVMGLNTADDILAIGIFALVFFHLLFGWKLLRMAAR